MHNYKDEIQGKLKSVFGHSQFRGDQEAIVLGALSGQDSLVLMPTGMGKSLCFQLPALAGQGTVLVISPLIALMQDQVDKARALGIRATCIHSQISKQEREERMAKLGSFQLVYVTPERFRKPEFVESIKSVKIQLLAIDEAHCISQWGHDFRPDYSRLGEIRQSLGNPPVMALTASATPQVQKDILSQLQMKEAPIYHAGIERPNLNLQVHDVYGLDEKIRSIVGLRFQTPGSAIVYVSLISTLYQISQELSKLNMDHLIYHGDLGAKERKRNQRLFIENENKLIIATPAFGLGVDKPDIRLLIHAEIPNSIESYYQEIGRAGRDGKESFCHLLLDPDDISIQMEFIKWANPDAGFISQVYSLIEKNQLRLQQEGFDFLRSQMNFYNKRDFRVETAVNILERLGCLTESKGRFPFETVQAPTTEMLDQKQIDQRLKLQNQKLLQMVQIAQMSTGCRMQEIYKYFGFDHEPCGKCDLCLERQKENPQC